MKKFYKVLQKDLFTPVFTFTEMSGFSSKDIEEKPFVFIKLNKFFISMAKN